MNKKQIKIFCRQNDIYQYELAKLCGVSEFTFIRWTRGNITREHEVIIKDAMEKILKKND